MAIYWIAILLITITFFYWQVFLRRVKATNEKITLLTRFTYNMTLLWINKLGNGHNFPLMTSAFLVEDFTQTNMFIWIYTNHEHVCLNMHCFCSFDNWLCDPISENWQLTLCNLFAIASYVPLMCTISSTSIDE